MRISDWSSDVCSSDLMARRFASDGQSAQVASATVLPEFAATVPLRTIRRNQGTSCRSTVFPSIRARMREWAEFSLSESDEGGVPTLALHGPWRIYSLGDLEPKLERLDQHFARTEMAGVPEHETTTQWLVSS